MANETPRPDATATVKRIALVSLASFVFAFSMVPLYNVACEKVFGIKLEKGPAGQARLAGTTIDTHRNIRVEFDGTVNSKLQWTFHPKQQSMVVHPGEQYEALYVARNESGEAIVGNAAPSIAPNEASGYFNKTECFCFTQQELDAGEQRDMPVRFIVSPSLPSDIATITLSYTFYRNDAATAAYDTAHPVAAAAHASP
jgi:cytochrome c oxidase assembly protein subunit 11